MATTRQPIARFDWIELLEPIDAAPAGAQGAVIDFIQDGTSAEIEIMTPDLEGLDRIVYATPSQLRRTDSPAQSTAIHTPRTDLC